MAGKDTFNPGKLVIPFLCSLMAFTLAGCQWLKNEKGEVPLALWVDAGSNTPMERGEREYPFRTIGQALEKAGDHTKIYVAPGEYRTNLKIENIVRIMRENDHDPMPVIIAKDPTKPVIEVSGGLGIKGVHVKGGTRGIDLTGDATLVMESCEIVGNREYGLHTSKTVGKKASVIQVELSKFSGNGVGLKLDGNKGGLLKNTISRNSGAGIIAEGDLMILCSHNTIEHQEGPGIDVRLSRLMKFQCTENTIRHNGKDGVMISGSGVLKPRMKLLFGGNRISDNGGYGLKLSRKKGEDKPNADEEPPKWLKLENNHYDGNARGHLAGVMEW
jgi:hypothetical protein